MQANDRSEFLKVINGMATMKKATLTPEVLDLWWGCMADWSVDDFRAAAVHVMKRAQFMPSPADFEALRKAGKPSSGEAWALVLDRVRKGASIWNRGEFTKDFVPPNELLINAAVEALGGYRVIAMHEEATLHFLERRFAEHYDAIADRQVIREALPQIAKRPDWLTLKLQEAQKKLTQS